MKLFDTASKQKVSLEPDGLTRLYVCGITPYDSAHMGHVATYLAFDVLRRTLEDQGHKTATVRNVTDIDDPLFERARRDGVDWASLGNRELASFRHDMSSLGLIPPDSEPRVTGAIDDVIKYVQTLEAKGHTYCLDGRIYFAIDTYEKFGTVSGYSTSEMVNLARERGGDVDRAGKKNSLDFLLWQPSASDEPSWDSPWGRGRPGWHIECSAMAFREFNGHSLDIHGGGEDLIFPHHECEAAQTQAATGQALARVWMHVGMVGLNGEKMSKSLGNLIFARDLLKLHEPAAIRLGVAACHYRSSWEWNQSIMDCAEARLHNWRNAANQAQSDKSSPMDSLDARAATLDAVRSVLDDDLDTPAALELIDEAAAHGTDVSQAASLLGITL